MKTFFSFLPLLLLTFSIFAQVPTIHCNLETGTVDQIMLRQGNMVLAISGDGNLSEIVSFRSSQEADRYMESPTRMNRPANKVQVGEVFLYLDEIRNVEYYAASGYYGNSHVAGKVKKIGTYSIQYYYPTGYSGSKALNGKIKKIGNLNIQYYSSTSYSGSGTLVGKVKKIGTYYFQYYFPDGYATGNQLKGKIKKLDYINFQYNYKNGFSGSGVLAGKLKAIGKYRFEYYPGGTYNRTANSGKFKALKGDDKRIKLVTRLH